MGCGTSTLHKSDRIYIGLASDDNSSTMSNNNNDDEPAIETTHNNSQVQEAAIQTLAGEGEGEEVTDVKAYHVTGGEVERPRREIFQNSSGAFSSSTSYGGCLALTLPTIPSLATRYGFEKLEEDQATARSRSTPNMEMLPPTHLSRHCDSISSARGPLGHRHPATSGSSLMPSIQSSEADRMRPASWSVPSGPSREPSPPSQFMTLVEGDGPTSAQMWAQLGADVMMEISRQRQATEISFLSQIS